MLLQYSTVFGLATQISRNMTKKKTLRKALFNMPLKPHFHNTKPKF